MSGLLVVTVDRTDLARRTASRFLMEVAPGVFAGIVNQRVREGLLEQLRTEVPQYTAVWQEHGLMQSEAQGIRADGRQVIEFDGVSVVSVPDNTARGRMFRERVRQNLGSSE